MGSSVWPSALLVIGFSSTAALFYHKELGEMAKQIIELGERDRMAHLEHLDSLFNDLRTQLSLEEESQKNNSRVTNQTNVGSHRPDKPLEDKISHNYCSFCNNQIEEGGKVICALEKKWHPEHFKCCFCERPIDSEHFMNNCWDQVYCEEHALDAPTCSSCTRIITPNSQYEVYDDDRHVCEYCSQTAVHDTETIKSLWNILIEDVFKLPKDSLKEIPLEFADRFKMLQEHRGEGVSNCEDHILGLTKTRTIVSSYSIRKTSAPPTSYSLDKVLILEGLPLLMTSVVLAHELGHCFARVEGYRLARKEEEGLSQLFAYIWLFKLRSWMRNKVSVEKPDILYLISSLTTEEIEFETQKIEGNTIELYRQGFAEALGTVQKGWTFRNTLKYLVQNKRYPNFEYGQDTQMEIRKPRTVSNGLHGPNELLVKFSATLETSLAFVKKGTVQLTEIFESTKKVVSTVLSPDPNHKRVVIVYGDTKLSIFYDSTNTPFSKFHQAIEERLESTIGKTNVTTISYRGVPLRCDEDLECLGDEAELTVESA